MLRTPLPALLCTDHLQKQQRSPARALSEIMSECWTVAAGMIGECHMTRETDPQLSPLLAPGPRLVRDLVLAAAALGCNR